MQLLEKKLTFSDKENRLSEFLWAINNEGPSIVSSVIFGTSEGLINNLILRLKYLANINNGKVLVSTILRFIDNAEASDIFKKDDINSYEIMAEIVSILIVFKWAIMAEYIDSKKSSYKEMNVSNRLYESFHAFLIDKAGLSIPMSNQLLKVLKTNRDSGKFKSV